MAVHPCSVVLQGIVLLIVITERSQFLPNASVISNHHVQARRRRGGQRWDIYRRPRCHSASHSVRRNRFELIDCTPSTFSGLQPKLRGLKIALITPETSVQYRWIATLSLGHQLNKYLSHQNQQTNNVMNTNLAFLDSQKTLGNCISWFAQRLLGNLVADRRLANQDMTWTMKSINIKLTMSTAWWGASFWLSE